MVKILQVFVGGGACVGLLALSSVLYFMAPPAPHAHDHEALSSTEHEGASESGPNSLQTAPTRRSSSAVPPECREVAGGKILCNHPGGRGRDEQLHVSAAPPSTDMGGKTDSTKKLSWRDAIRTHPAKTTADSGRQLGPLPMGGPDQRTFDQIKSRVQRERSAIDHTTPPRASSTSGKPKKFTKLYSAESSESRWTSRTSATMTKKPEFNRSEAAPNILFILSDDHSAEAVGSLLQRPRLISHAGSTQFFTTNLAA